MWRPTAPNQKQTTGRVNGRESVASTRPQQRAELRGAKAPTSTRPDITSRRHDGRFRISDRRRDGISFLVFDFRKLRVDNLLFPRALFAGASAGGLRARL